MAPGDTPLDDEEPLDAHRLRLLSEARARERSERLYSEDDEGRVVELNPKKRLREGQHKSGARRRKASGKTKEEREKDSRRMEIQAQKEEAS